MKLALKSILTIILLALAYAVGIQGVAPIYETPSTNPFNGEFFFTPYTNVDLSKTVKANFHAHTKFDTKEEYTEAEFEKSYVDAGFDYIGVANHNFITNSLIHRENYIPTYENGWNVNNYHILVLGAKTNNLLDNLCMVFPQSQMQWKINQLRDDAPILSLNHPERFRLARNVHYKYIRGYDLMEANTNNIRTIWDEVLSVGNYIPLLSSDDAHEIYNLSGRPKRSYTVVLADNNADSILSAIKQGRSYGVVGRGENPAEKHPRFKQFQIINDTLNVTLDSVANSIIVIANGKTIAQTENTNKLIFPIKNTPNYIRIEALYNNITLVSNPIARSPQNARPLPLPIPEVNTTLTIINSVFWAIATLFVLWLIFKLWKKQKKDPRKRKENFENYTWGAGLKSYDPS